MKKLKISQKPKKKKKKCGKFEFLKAMRAGSWDRLFFSLALNEKNQDPTMLFVCFFKWSSKRNSLTIHLGIENWTLDIARVNSKLTQGHFLQTF